MADVAGSTLSRPLLLALQLSVAAHVAVAGTALLFLHREASVPALFIDLTDATVAKAPAGLESAKPSLPTSAKPMVPSARITCLERPYQPGDVVNAALVIAATGDPKVNAQVRADARRAGVLVAAVVDEPENSDFIVPAVVRRGDLLLALSSGSASPRFVGQLRRELDLLMPDDAAVLLRLLGKARQRVQRAEMDPERRQELMNQLLNVNSLSTLRTSGSRSCRQGTRRSDRSGGDANAS